MGLKVVIYGKTLAFSDFAERCRFTGWIIENLMKQAFIR